MFYKYNGMVGRVVTATNLQTPLYPIKPAELYRDVPKLQFDTTYKFATVTSATSRAASSGPVDDRPTVPEHIKRKMKLFQAKNGLPVHLKGGVRDVFFYRLSWTMGIIGCLWSIKYMYDSATKI